MKKLLLLTIMVLFQVALFAQKTYVYFQNSTPLTFTVSSQQTGPHTMETNEWWASTANINPWQNETNVLWTNRDAGIHNGTDFYLTTTLTSGSTSVELKLRLNGNFIGSNIWSAAAGPGFSHPWTSDNNFHTQLFTIGAKQYELKYTFYFTGGYDDILFTIHELDAFSANASELSDPNIMNVLAYNTYLLTPPIAFSDQATRAKHIDEAVHDVDAILLQEVFDNSSRATLTAQLAAEYPYQTEVLDLPNVLEDGGVMIVSRWPIEYSTGLVFSDCLDVDCLSNKGVMYARINKLGKKYHLFSTHQNAQQIAGDPGFVATRILQMQEFNAFIDAQNIPADEAVIFGGDMNVDKHANFLNEYNDMLTIFNAAEPTYLGYPNTWDKYANHYVDPGTVEPEYLDYVLADNDYLVPEVQSNEVWVLRSNHNDMWNIHDLSDHFAILGRFEYPIDPCDTTVIVASSLISDESVDGLNDGAIDLTVSGGLSPYTFLWSNGGITEDLSGLADGTYTVTITDANGCTGNASGTVAAGPDICEITTISGSTNVTDESVDGVDDGTIDLTVSGGLLPYTFLWSNGGTTEDISGLADGTYTVTITDANGCTGNASGTVAAGPDICEVTTISGSTNVTDESVDGVDDGTIDLTVSGGLLPYTFLWSNGSTTEDISGLADGTYTVTITDANGCTGNASGTVAAGPDICEVTTISGSTNVADESVDGVDDGAIDLTVSGGLLPYTFLWSNGGTTEDISGLADGTYTVTITDANGCTGTASGTVVAGIPVGLLDIDILDALSVYPVPTYNLVNIDVSLNQNGNIQLELFDVNGRQLQKASLGIVRNINHAIDLSAYASGVYFIKVAVDNEYTIVKVPLIR